MKKISSLAGIAVAAILLCGIFGCNNTETVEMTSASIEMIGDPIVTDKAAIFQWKDSVANGSIIVTRQAPGEEEVTISGEWYSRLNNGFADRVGRNNLLKAGVEYTYRFYNASDVSTARKAYTLEKKYSCVERKVIFESVAPVGTKLAPITDEQVTITKFEANGKNYVSVYVDEKEAGCWIDIYNKTYDYKLSDVGYDTNIGGVEGIEYDPYQDYEIRVGKWWPGPENDDENRYYDASETEKKFDLPATKNDITFDISYYDIIYNDSYKNVSYKVSWSGKKGSKYEISFKAFDNKDAEVNLNFPKITDDKIKRDDFYTCLAEGKLSELIDISKAVSFKTVKAIVKETAADGTVTESESGEKEIGNWNTTYTVVYSNLYISPFYNDETKYVIVSVSGSNLPNTAKLYYKKGDDRLYTEFKDGLKKDESGNLVATISIEDTYYTFKAIVTMENAKWYDWEEDKTEEVVEGSYYYWYPEPDPEKPGSDEYDENW